MKSFSCLSAQRYHHHVGELSRLVRLLLVLHLISIPKSNLVQAQMVKMCLFYRDPSGHARSDPIINQTCPSDHIHTFYGPQQIHPNTTFEDLRNTSPERSTTPFEENQSLYWHPTIYEVTTDSNGVETYTRAPNIFTSPYYRWINTDDIEKTEAFPDGFRMIAHSTDDGAQQAGESGGNMLVECCQLDDDEEEEEDCEFWDYMTFPEDSCDFLGIAFAMPTCWNGGLGIDNGPGHKDHMAYTEDGRVDGPCPDSHPRRLPQIQLFVRVIDYKGGKYTFSDGNTDVFHVDFMNGWDHDTLQDIIDNCPVEGDEDSDNYNPPCNCDQFLTENTDRAGVVCDVDVHNMILNETTDIIQGSLPRGTCEGADIIPKSWDIDPILTCFTTPTPEEESGLEGSEEETGESEEEDGEEEESEEDDNMNCEDECCFEGLNECYEAIESMCGQNVKFRNCITDCEEMEALIDVEADDVESCYDECDKFHGECFEVEELLCEPCEDEDRARKY